MTIAGVGRDEGLDVHSLQLADLVAEQVGRSLVGEADLTVRADG
jgi:hypothetical protein